MVKPKQKHLASVIVKGNNSQKAHEGLNNAVDINMQGEDSWVIVKKQRVTVLIPPLPDIQQPTNLEEGQLQGDVPSNLTNTTPQPQTNNSPDQICLADRNDGLISVAPTSSTQSSQKICPQENVVAIVNPKKLDLGKSKSEDQGHALKPSNRKEKHAMKFHKVPTNHKNISHFKQPRLSGVGNLLSATTSNKIMRAWNLERKIARAGGLSKWLSSLGLDQFVTILHGGNANKFLLVNLSMKKLKDMGAHAVGPRRKLIHAIEGLCEPYCLGGSQS